MISLVRFPFTEKVGMTGVGRARGTVIGDGVGEGKGGLRVAVLQEKLAQRLLSWLQFLRGMHFKTIFCT